MKVNKTDSDKEKKDVKDMDRKNLEEQSKIEQAISHKPLQVMLKQKKKRKTIFVIDIKKVQKNSNKTQ